MEIKRSSCAVEDNNTGSVIDLSNLPIETTHFYPRPKVEILKQIEVSGEMTTNFFKQNLQYLLETKDIKQSQLARDTDISKQAISDWLNKNSTINAPQAIRVSKYFNVTVEDLYLKNLKNCDMPVATNRFDDLNKIKIPCRVIGFDGSYKFANQAFCDLLGFDVYDINSRPMIDLIHDEALMRAYLMRNRLVNDVGMYTQDDTRFLTAKLGFRWLHSIYVSSIKDKCILAFSFPIKDQSYEEISIKKVRLDTIMKDELEKLHLMPLSSRKIKFKNELELKLSIKSDLNILKCLLRSLFCQFHYIDLDADANHEVLLSCRDESASVLLSATIKCSINPRGLDLRRVKKVASVVGAEVTESYHGNVYSFSISFPRK